MIYRTDPYLEPYRQTIDMRHKRILDTVRWISDGHGSLKRAVNNHLYYGVHREDGEWVMREWAPGATRIYAIGDFNGWKRDENYALKPTGGGNWELRLPSDALRHGDLFKWFVEWPGGGGERIPAYATRCVQDASTKLFSAQIWAPAEQYGWRCRKAVRVSSPLIYEAHIGMSSEAEEVASFNYFTENVLPRVAQLGYNTIQLMALQEHPYYGSFGYQVSNFYALSSRYGTPEEFKRLVDEAHRLGLAVIMDLVHSHAVKNELEGLSRFDGTYTTYFHGGDRGNHPAWDSRCFDYGKSETIHFLLSNCKFWMEEYHLDGFRFDGVTSMLYHNHGLGVDFCGYDNYFSGGVDDDAVVYLALANTLIHQIKPNAITIAEDMSGMAGLAAPIPAGGVGFDYRMSMGVPDMWIKWIKERDDHDWDMGTLWYELTNKRSDEKTISYAECHDQALVGDKTIIFRLIDKEMYYSMDNSSKNVLVDRGVALHKMIRLVTLATAGNGYLNFMGNEFGHPEWIDFPREGNNWSFAHARRLWSISDDENLRYGGLKAFDGAMIQLFRDEHILEQGHWCYCADNSAKVLAFTRGDYLFVFNFHPENSYPDYTFEAPEGEWRVALDSDAGQFGGFSRNDAGVTHHTTKREGKYLLSLYLPSRTALVLRLDRQALSEPV
ncbi:MAG: alpha amylase C-terminal domain-containing protein [Bacteroidales bacterium]|nr:alpha amylase C-terminal domain-containing protein [Bacteroidales bacterium]